MLKANKAEVSAPLLAQAGDSVGISASAGNRVIPATCAQTHTLTQVLWLLIRAEPVVCMSANSVWEQDGV